MDRELLKDVLIEQDRQRTGTIVKRSLIEKVDEFRDTPFVLIISGIRRCGKSTLLRTLKDDRSYYINFDDERLIGLTVKDLALIQNLLIELFGERRVFLLDEIQNISGWERFVRRLQDEGMKVYVTGSNATMLSRELGTHLTGRNISLSLYPFSFKEYLDFKQIPLESPERMTSNEKSLMKRAFSNYLKDGGFPEYLMTGKEEYLQSLYQNILYRDIITRYGLTSEKPIKEAAFYAASNIAKEMSFNTVRKLTGLSSATTVKGYYNYMENSYLTFLVNRYDHSAKKQIYYSKKIYFIDTALARLVGFRPTEDRGRMLENVVYVALRRRGGEIFFHKGKRECDFIVRNNAVISEAVQVTTELKGKREREIGGLIEALLLYDLDSGLLLTHDQEGSIRVEGKDILIKPVWQWLMENDS